MCIRDSEYVEPVHHEYEHTTYHYEEPHHYVERLAAHHDEYVVDEPTLVHETVLSHVATEHPHGGPVHHERHSVVPHHTRESVEHEYSPEIAHHYYAEHETAHAVHDEPRYHYYQQ